MRISIKSMPSEYLANSLKLSNCEGEKPEVGKESEVGIRVFTCVLQENVTLIAELTCFSDVLLLCPALVYHPLFLFTVFFRQCLPLIFFMAGTKLGPVLSDSKCSERRRLSSLRLLSLTDCSRSRASVLIKFNHGVFLS